MMSVPTSWLFGALTVASLIMCFGLWPIVRKEMLATPQGWWGNRAFWLAFALLVHGAGAVVIFGALLFAKVEWRGGIVLNMLWIGLGLWLASKTAVIHVTGRLQLALALYLLWTVVWIAWRISPLWT